jgi:hypothetical protein
MTAVLSNVDAYFAARQAAINNGKKPHSILDIKYMSYQEIQQHGKRDYSGVSLSLKGASFHDVYFNDGVKNRRASFTFSSGVINMNGVKDSADINKDSSALNPSNPLKVDTNDVDVQFNMPFSNDDQPDPEAIKFLTCLYYFNDDCRALIQEKILENKVATSNTKINSFIQTHYSMKTNVTINDPKTNTTISAAGQPLKCPIIRGEMKFYKKFIEGVKIPYTKVYDVRESFKNLDVNTGEVKWVEAKYNNESINGLNYMNYITSQSKIWNFECSIQVNQSNFGPSIKMSVFKITVEHVPVKTEAKAILSSDMIERMKQLSLTAPVAVVVENANDHSNEPSKDDDSMPPSGAIIGSLSSSNHPVITNLSPSVHISANPIQMNASDFLNNMQMPGTNTTTATMQMSMPTMPSMQMPMTSSIPSSMPSGMPSIQMPM